MIGLGLYQLVIVGTALRKMKTLEDYYARLEKNEIPVYRGHLLTEEDLIIRQHYQFNVLL